MLYTMGNEGGGGQREGKGWLIKSLLDASGYAGRTTVKLTDPQRSTPTHRVHSRSTVLLRINLTAAKDGCVFACSSCCYTAVAISAKGKER